MLNPKEKAKELVDRYYNLFSVDLENTISIYEAKECALTAIDYIIGSIPTQPSSTEMERMDAIVFWINVKSEIENL